MCCCVVEIYFAAGAATTFSQYASPFSNSDPAHCVEFPVVAHLLKKHIRQRSDDTTVFRAEVRRLERRDEEDDGDDGSEAEQVFLSMAWVGLGIDANADRADRGVKSAAVADSQSESAQ